MKKSNILKVFALTNFIFLIVVFLMYRNGSFDKEKVVPEKEMKSEIVKENKLELNQVVEKKTEAKVPSENENSKRLSSSKSLILIDEAKKTKSTAPTSGPTIFNSEKEEKQILPSSKSAIIFKPTPTDTSKKNKK